ncbi:MAG: hypothetical protein AAF328_08505 [Planctomycetota bacterium]
MAAETTQNDAPLNPSAVPMEQLSRLLGVPMDDLCRHVAQGAPTNANGSINLVHYAAWLNAPGSSDTAQRGAPEGDA